MITAQRIFEILMSDSASDINSLLHELPKDSFTEIPENFLRSEGPLTRLLEVMPVVIKLCSGVDSEIGSRLAWAAHEFSVHLYENGNRNILPYTMSSLALSYMNALNLLGRSWNVN
jgi:hypothetical protein